MTKEITKYQCDHCKREYVNKDRAERHEDKCYYDPANHACVTCAHLLACEDERHEMWDGHDHCTVFWDVDCDLDLAKTYLPGEGYQNTFKHNCDSWEPRTVEGTYKFGKTFIEKA